MRWNIRYFLPLVFFVAFFAFIKSPSVSAVSDFTYTWDWSTHPSYYLCGSDSGRSCSDYSYVIFEPSGSCTDNAPSFYVAGLGSFSSNSSISPCSKIISTVDSSFLYITGGRYLADRFSGTILVTLTDSLGSIPTGSITFTENGTFDVSSYAEAVVDVPATTVPGDYHDDLEGIRVGIYICAGVLLVLYFFYCIYSMLIKGVK